MNPPNQDPPDNADDTLPIDPIPNDQAEEEDDEEVVYATDDDDDEIDTDLDNPDGARMDIGFVASGLTRIQDIAIPDRFFHRFRTGIVEIDELFGGEDSPGILPGSVITCCAPNGMGKTTFWIEALRNLQNHGLNVGYFSGEESREQLAYKMRRHNVGEVPIGNEISLETILKNVVDGKLDIIVIDSFQALTCEAIAHLRGKRLQQHMINMIVKCAQQTSCAIVVIMHMTKGGQLKGDTCVPHTADVSFVIRSGAKEYGDKNIRILECPQKNRNGPTGVEFLAMMSGGGYKFDVKIDLPEETPEGGKINKRTATKQAEMEAIMNLPFPTLTAEMVMDALKVDYNYAYGRLTELTNNKRLTKLGKGKDAMFCKNQQP